jgi:TRAP-type mannitol/chloroaromatic compound transport system permease small subunit
MQAIIAVLRGITRLNDFIGRWVALLILLIFVLLIAEIGFRYILGAPMVWTGELTQMVFGVYAVLSGGYILAHGGHVNVDLIYTRFSPRTKAIIDILTSVLFFLFVGALLYFGSSLAYESMEFWERSQSAWNPPIWPVKLMIPVSAVLILLQGIVKLARDICVVLDSPLANQLEVEGTSGVHH